MNNSLFFFAPQLEYLQIEVMHQIAMIAWLSRDCQKLDKTNQEVAQA